MFYCGPIQVVKRRVDNSFNADLRMISGIRQVVGGNFGAVTHQQLFRQGRFELGLQILQQSCLHGTSINFKIKLSL